MQLCNRRYHKATRYTGMLTKPHAGRHVHHPVI
uniref:Uncharacterized protein n=1 Tax=Arundo donax TaxID=35708 RepID=A0A0A8ZH48_ARUDO